MVFLLKFPVGGCHLLPFPCAVVLGLVMAHLPLLLSLVQECKLVGL